MKCILWGLSAILIMLPSLVLGENLLPDSLVYYNYPGKHVLIVDKSGCEVRVYRYQEQWGQVAQYKCTTGKKEGDKFKEGDERTPLGIYWLNNGWTGNELVSQYGDSAAIYGLGAFELNYPNYIDKLLYNKSGYGIWLHGTDKGEPSATRGCVSTSNSDLAEISRYIEFGQTPILIEEKVNYVTPDQIERQQNEILTFLDYWKKAWESDDLANFLSFYSKDFQTPRFNYRQWQEYKQVVNSLNTNRRVEVSDISILKSKDLYSIQFLQRFTSDRTRDVGKKQLYLVQEAGLYKILSENWEPEAVLPHKPSFNHYAYKLNTQEESL
ncbi:MAG: L,D-transpeptidase family protein [SAR324 cluster bacterium]|nr:L,D-transpeptidase family protein [SAR324 cluster bacterium]